MVRQRVAETERNPIVFQVPTGEPWVMTLHPCGCVLEPWERAEFLKSKIGAAS